MRNIIVAILVAVGFTSCEKVVEIKYKDNQSKVVIEGNVTNATGPYYVKISKSISLSNTGSVTTIDNADVTISDDLGNTETLTAIGGGVYKTSTLQGIPGRTYTLNVQADNQTYTATSTMPEPVTFDSVKVEKLVTSGETEYNLIPIYTDPAEKSNYYRFELSVNDKIINQQFILNDELKNGVVNTFRLEINNDDLKLKVDDKINVVMQCIDAKVASYYTMLALIADSGPGGGITPNNPQTNISNGALCVFSAHTVQKRETNAQ